MEQLNEQIKKIIKIERDYYFLECRVKSIEKAMRYKSNIFLRIIKKIRDTEVSLLWILLYALVYAIILANLIK